MGPPTISWLCVGPPCNRRRRHVSLVGAYRFADSGLERLRHHNNMRSKTIEPTLLTRSRVITQCRVCFRSVPLQTHNLYLCVVWSICHSELAWLASSNELPADISSDDTWRPGRESGFSGFPTVGLMQSSSATSISYSVKRPERGESPPGELIHLSCSYASERLLFLRLFNLEPADKGT